LFVGTLMTGSNLAGLPDRGDEKASMATSSWTNLVTNLQTGNHLVTASLLNVPTASGLPLSLQLAHNSMNASIDVGVGKGWMTNLHTCVSEDGGLSMDALVAAIDMAELMSNFLNDLKKALEDYNMYNKKKGIIGSFEVYIEAEKKCRKLCKKYAPEEEEDV
jgi:hypothetical protein